jgi:hypothetical protein
VNAFSGNVQFRALLKEYKYAYDSAKKMDKVKVIDGLIQKIRSMGGRFLQEDKERTGWVDIGDARAKKKCAQAMRETKVDLDDNAPSKDHEVRMQHDKKRRKYCSSGMYYMSSSQRRQMFQSLKEEPTCPLTHMIEVAAKTSSRPMELMEFSSVLTDESFAISSTKRSSSRKRKSS